MTDAAERMPRWVIVGLRDADWLTPERARTWCRVLAAVIALFVVVWIALSHDGVDREGKPLGTDFVSFWTAARMAREGHVAEIYDLNSYAAAQVALFPEQAGGRYLYPYPPPFLLLCLPFAWLPYLVALVVWQGVTFAAFYFVVRRLVPERWAILAIFAYPAVFVNLGHGHNGFLSAACLGAGMLLLTRRPLLAGLCLGILVYKPHLLVAGPIVLLAARRWRVIAGAAASSLGLCAASWLVLGKEAWVGFSHMTALSRLTVEQGIADFWKMQSPFAALRLLHANVSVAYAVQIALVAVLFVVVAKVAWKRPGAGPEGATLIAATLLCPPYLMDYDLVCLALPIAWVAAEALRSEWLPWEKVVLFSAYALPLFARPVAMATSISLAPPIMIALLVVVARRAGREGAGEAIVLAGAGP